jgi:hypothetical protein
MPYYNGRWHKFSEAERAEFGRRQAAQESKKWHATWISKAGLKDRLWTDKAITDFLGKPADAGPIKAWKIAEVEAAEKTEGFKAWLKTRKAWLASRGKLETVDTANEGSE